MSIREKCGYFSFEKDVAGNRVVLCGEIYWGKTMCRWVAVIGGGKPVEGIGTDSD